MGVNAIAGKNLPIKGTVARAKFANGDCDRPREGYRAGKNFLFPG